MLRLDNVCKIYPHGEVLKEVSWEVKPGSRIGLVGANGCGKSSLFAAILGDLPLESGAMELPPEVISGLKDGSILVAMGTNWWLQGYTATRMLAEAARGEELPEGWVNTGQQLFTGEDVAAVGAVPMRALHERRRTREAPRRR